MDYVTAHPWSFALFCFLAGCFLWQRMARKATPAELRPDITDAEIESAAREGRYIDAIRLYRRRGGAGLKEAKDAVDAIVQRNRN